MTKPCTSPMTWDDFEVYPYRTRVTAEPRWRHPMGQHLDERLVKWAWNPWSFTDSGNTGIYGEVCFARERDQIIFNLACGEWIR